MLGLIFHASFKKVNVSGLFAIRDFLDHGKYLGKALNRYHAKIVLSLALYHYANCDLQFKVFSTKCKYLKCKVSSWML